MAAQEIQIRTPDGTADGYVHRPSGPAPGVIFLPDAFGVRPAMHDHAERLAKLGYAVLLPNVLYRAGKIDPFDPATTFSNAKERERLMPIIKAIDTAAAIRDVAAYADALLAQKDVRGTKVGITGYCLGGRMAISAAGGIPERIGAACSFHGGNLVNDQPDSPHLLAPKIKAQVYLGIADDDRGCTPEHQATLASTFGAAKVHYQLELYPHAQHGFAMADTPAYNREASERHFARLQQVLGESLGS